MDFLTSAVFITLISFLIYRFRLLNDERLSPVFITFIFIIKSLLGILYCHVHIKNYGGGDTYAYFNDGNIIFETLRHNPLKYIYLTFFPNAVEINPLVRDEIFAMGFWGDTSAYMVVRFNALVRLVSGGNIFIHAVAMSFLSLAGMLLFYKSIYKATGSKSFRVKMCIFLIPSFLFWGSGVHKEGLLIFSLGLLFYGSVFLAGKVTFKNLLITIAGAGLTLLIRDFVLLLLLPGWVAFMISHQNKKQWLLAFPLVYVFALFAGSILPVIEGKTILEMISLKQDQFWSIRMGNTEISLRDFEPHILSFFTNLPTALKNSILGPFFISADSVFHILVMLENAMLILLFVVLLFLPGAKSLSAFSLWCLLFGLSWFLLIGYTVPNVGAIVRYRSIALPFLLLFAALRK